MSVLAAAQSEYPVFVVVTCMTSSCDACPALATNRQFLTNFNVSLPLTDFSTSTYSSLVLQPNWHFTLHRDELSVYVLHFSA